MHSSRQSAVPIAIIGIGCRFPGGVRDAVTYWELLSRGRCAIREIPQDRWSLTGFWDPQPDLPDRSYSKWGGFLDDIRGFDPAYFGLSQREAEGMDPQQRLLLMTAVEAAQDAVIPLSTLRERSTGVFVGVSNVDYGLLQRFRPGQGEMQAGTGTALSIAANRVSNRLDLSGPSMGVDTACSSALVALDTACRHLADGSCDFAFAGGVNVLLDPRMFITFSRAHMLSPTGQIRAFDGRADGFVRGEGVGLVLLRRLDAALEAGDDILAVIRSTAVNQDGRTGTITEPSCEAQMSMLRAALQRAELSPCDIAYAEAHGTGTPVGDPIEARALGTVLGRDRLQAGALPIGSVKTNIGHLEPAAGIAGLIKVVLILKHGAIPPSLGYESVNPAIDLDALGLTIAAELCPLPQTPGVPCAAVNSFGFGGTNACAVLQAYTGEGSKVASAGPGRADPRNIETCSRESAVVVPLSGPTPGHVEALAARLLRELDGNGALAESTIEDLAAALGSMRAGQEHRAAIVARSRLELAERLEWLSHGREWPSTDRHAPPQIVRGRVRTRPKVVFTMTGQGGQWWAMGRELLETEPVFRQVFERFDTLFVPVSGWSTLAEISADEATSRIDDAAITPAVMFAFQAGLAEVWRARGVTPDIVLGQSFGEVTAAYLAGGIGMAEVARLVKYRGLIRGAVDRRGSMAAIGLGADAIAQHLPRDGSIEIGGYNSPSLVTVTGDEAAIDALIARLNAEDPAILTRKLALDFAYHSSWFAPVEHLFKADVGELATAQPRLPVVSTVTGEVNTDFSADYWWRNLRQPVLYQAGIETALRMGGEVFIELGPHRTLSSMTAACAAAMGRQVTTIASLDRRWGDPTSIAVATAQSWTSGVEIDWLAANKGDARGVRLPLQPWLLREIWSEPEEADRHMRPVSVHPLLGRRTAASGHIWRSDVSLASQPWLSDHRLDGACVMPAAAYLEMLYCAAQAVLGVESIELVDVVFPSALYLGSDDELVFETRYNDARRRLEIRSRARGSQDWELRAAAFVFPFDGRLDEHTSSRGREVLDVAKFYETAQAQGYGWGHQFQGLKRIEFADEGARGEIEVETGGPEGMALDPRILDSALQLMLAQNGSLAESGIAPSGIARLVTNGPLRGRCSATAVVSALPSRSGFQADVSIEDRSGRRVIIEQLNAVPRRSKALPPLDARGAHFLQEEWREIDASCWPEKRSDLVVLATAKDPRAAAIRHFLSGRGLSCSIQQLNPDGLGSVSCAARVVLLIPGCSREASIDEAALNAAALMVDVGKALVRAGKTDKQTALDVVTIGARSIGDSMLDGSGVSHAAAIGVLRTLAMEMPEVFVRTIDLGGSEQVDLDALADLLTRDSGETEFAIRGGRVYCSRLMRIRAEDLPPRSISRCRLPDIANFELRQAGRLGADSLVWRGCQRNEPGPDEITVEVRAVGLNFRDLMAVAGLLPADAEPVAAIETLGLELCGTVVSRGDNVCELEVGDRVFGMGSGALHRFVTWPAASFSRVPQQLNDIEAATIPSAFLTAQYSLNELARLQPGETVLIHSAAGGVGLATMALAKRAGARVIATAGTIEKRRHLEQLGAEFVIDSRSLAFEAEVRRVTEGRGADVVLNSLGGAFIDKGLACLAPYGRFLELGKRDVWGDGTLALKALRANASLHVVDLAALILGRPDFARRMMRSVSSMLQSGEITALPSTVFKASRVGEAFGFFAEAKHIGKIVVDMDDADVVVGGDRDGGFRADGNSTYLVTGGSRGFGAAVAGWLVERGAGRVVVASRTAKPGNQQKRIEVAELDIRDAKAVDRLIAKLARGKLPLKGVVHAAVVYDDALLPQMSLGRLERVMAPKLSGALNLTRAIERAGVGLDFFVSFSSLAQVVGWPGQSNYAAANSALEALAHWQRSRGIKGQCINWGALGESGHVARSGQMQGYLTSAGWIALSDAQALQGLNQLLTSEAVSVTFTAADWPRLAQSYPAIASSSRVGHLGGQGVADQHLAGGLAGLSGERLQAAALRLVTEQAAKVLRTDVSELEGSSRLDEAGVDSLSSFELRNRIGQAIGYDLPMSRYAAARTFEALAQLVVSLLTERSESSG